MKSHYKFGQNLKVVRKELSLTQQEVALRAKLHTNYYARIERGEENPSFETIEKIVKALKTTSADVLPF